MEATVPVPRIASELRKVTMPEGATVAPAPGVMVAVKVTLVPAEAVEADSAMLMVVGVRSSRTTNGGAEP